MTAQIKSIAWPRLVGTALMLASLGFIALLLWSHWQSLASFRPTPGDILMLALGALAYGAAGWLLAGAWQFLLSWSGEAEARWEVSRRIYARTQLAKYVPGKVAQFLGRHMIGRQAGWSHVGLVMSTAFEVLLLLGVAVAVAILGLAATGMQVEYVNLSGLALTLLGLGAAVLVFVYVIPRVAAARWPEIADRIASRPILALWPAVLLYIGFFLIGGLVLLLVCDVVLDNGIAPSHWPAVISLFAMGWAAGIITPGVPSGLGVREAVLVVGLGSMMPVAQAALIATLLRLLTLSGDLLFFSLCSPRLRVGRTGERKA